jgi:hypothetical protein
MRLLHSFSIVQPAGFGFAESPPGDRAWTAGCIVRQPDMLSLFSERKGESRKVSDDDRARTSALIGNQARVMCIFIIPFLTQLASFFPSLKKNIPLSYTVCLRSSSRELLDFS